MNNVDCEVDERIISKYLTLNRRKKIIFQESKDRVAKEYFVDRYIRRELASDKYSEIQVTDMLVKYLFENRSTNKTTLWSSFGHIIIANLELNLPSNTKLCEVCGDRFEYNMNCKTLPKYCDKCATQVKNEQIRLIMYKKRHKK